MVRPVQESDIPAICAIYNHFILETTITFEETPVDFAIVQQRIAKIQQQGLPWLVAEKEDQVVG